MTQISIEEIREHLPHVDADGLIGRYVPLHAIYEEKGWKMWMQNAKGGLQSVQAVPVEACYFSNEKACENDLRLRPIEFFQQRTGWQDIAPLEGALLSDIRNLAASLAKLQLLFNSRASISGAGRMAATEMEYIFVVCRSAFDLFQKAFGRIWKRVDLIDKSAVKHNLPESFRKMVMQGDDRMAAEDIATKHHLPDHIASAYEETGQFFEWLRDYRDLMSHHGAEIKCVFVTERGFAVSTKSRPFSGMDIWCEKNTLPNNLGSLRSAAQHAVLETLRCMDVIIHAFESVVRFPPPVVPDYCLLVCGPNLDQIALLESGIKDDPWYA